MEMVKPATEDGIGSAALTFNREQILQKQCLRNPQDANRRIRRDGPFCFFELLRGSDRSGPAGVLGLF